MKTAVVGLLFIFIYTFGPSSGVSQSVYVPQRLLVVSSESEIEQMDALISVLSAYFQDLNIDVVLNVTEHPREVFEQVSAAKSLVQRNHAFSAIWIDRSSKELFLFVSKDSSSNIFMQTFAGSEDGWVVECETIAVLARSALVGWLSLAEEQPEASAAVKAPKKKPVQVKDSDETKNDSTHPSHQNAPLLFSIGTGYSPKLIHYAEPISHNIHLSLAARLKSKAVFEVSVHGGPALRFNADGENVWFWHMPVYIKSGPIFSVGHLTELGLFGAFVLDIARVIGNLEGVESDVDRVHPGVGIYAKIALHLRPFISPYLSVGTDFFVKSVNYNWDSHIGFHYHAIQPSILLGLEILPGRKSR